MARFFCIFHALSFGLSFFSDGSFHLKLKCIGLLCKAASSAIYRGKHFSPVPFC